MKKKLILILTFIIGLTIPFITINAEQTLGQLEAELNKKEAELSKNEAAKAANAENISKVKGQINSIYSQMASIQKEIDNKIQESVDLQEKIKKKNEEIVNLMRYYQVSSSGSSILEYIMGADTLTDLIYRLSITEQITTYNKKAIKQMNDIIAQNEKIKADLNKKNTEMAALQKELSANLAKLSEDQQNLGEEAVSISTSIKDMKSTISYLKSKGCSKNETQRACLNRIYSSSSGGNGGYLPSGTNFLRPVKSGRISSEFGYRPSLGDFHYGTDISVPIGTPVYAVATGRVAKTKSGDSCGTQIMLHHTVNGKNYTSWYCHLSRVNVSIGQLVTTNTVIGYSGNTGFSTGPHLHLSMATGWWYADYYNYSGAGGYTSRAFNSRNVIVFPGYYVPWYNR